MEVSPTVFVLSDDLYLTSGSRLRIITRGFSIHLLLFGGVLSALCHDQSPRRGTHSCIGIGRRIGCCLGCICRIFRSGRMLLSLVS